MQLYQQARSTHSANCCNFWSNVSIFISFKIYNTLYLCNHLNLFELGGTVKSGEDEGDSLSYFKKSQPVFIDKPLALPRSAKGIYTLQGGPWVCAVLFLVLNILKNTIENITIRIRSMKLQMLAQGNRFVWWILMNLMTQDSAAGAHLIENISFK